jgi:hypothetical protein
MRSAVHFHEAPQFALTIREVISSNYFISIDNGSYIIKFCYLYSLYKCKFNIIKLIPCKSFIYFSLANLMLTLPISRSG